MADRASYALLADAVLVLHAAFVAFVVLGLALIYAGARRWQWVRNPWFRAAHLAAIGVVMAQSWVGMICPLTALEQALRTRAGATYTGGFIAHWLERLLYWQAPDWVFTAAYTLFAALVVASWPVVRPRAFRGR